MNRVAYIKSATVTVLKPSKAVLRPVEDLCGAHSASQREGLDTERKGYILNLPHF
jgi:hypothetical protein